MATVSRSAHAARAIPMVPLTVPSIEVAAIAGTIGQGFVDIDVDDSLDVTVIRLQGNDVEVGRRIMLKGSGDARRRFLDDPRNAPKLGASIRDAFSKANPSLAPRFAQLHKKWSRPFARRVLAWQRQLQGSAVFGQTIRDEFQRRYALEWAGATVSPGGRPSPQALANVPLAPQAPTLQAYSSHIDALVQALMQNQN